MKKKYRYAKQIMPGYDPKETVYRIHEDGSYELLRENRWEQSADEDARFNWFNEPDGNGWWNVEITKAEAFIEML